MRMKEPAERCDTRPGIRFAAGLRGRRRNRQLHGGRGCGAPLAIGGEPEGVAP